LKKCSCNLRNRLKMNRIIQDDERICIQRCAIIKAEDASLTLIRRELSFRYAANLRAVELLKNPHRIVELAGEVHHLIFFAHRRNRKAEHQTGAALRSPAEAEPQLRAAIVDESR